MKINKLVVENKDFSLFPEKFEFNFHGNTIIKSKVNSLGKTSLIRFLLFSLGYKIPSTNGINLSLYKTSLFISRGDSEYIIERKDNLVLISTMKEEKFVYNIRNKDERNSLQMFIFGSDKPDFVEQLLGCFYIDQESGWVTSSSGKILLYNDFSTKELISSLLSDYTQEVNSKLSDTNSAIKKYNALYNLLNTDNSLSDEQLLVSESLFNASYKENKLKYSALIAKKQRILAQIRKIEKLMNSNNTVAETIADYKLVIKKGNEEPFVLTKDLIYNFDINNDLLFNQLYSLKTEIKSVNKEILEIENVLKTDSLSLNIKEISDDAIRLIKVSNISANSVKDVLEQLRKERAKYEEEKDQIIKSKEIYYNDLFMCLKKRIIDMGYEKKLEGINLVDFNAKSQFSGVELNDICFAYKLGCLDFVKKMSGIQLPIIIDSPGLGEREIQNLKTMLDYLLKNYEGQIIVSTAMSVGDELFDWHIEAEGLIFNNKYKEY